MILIDKILKDKTCLEKIYNIGDYKPKNKKCLIVGSCNESLQSIDWKKYIQNCDCDIIAIQSMYNYVSKIKKCLYVGLFEWKIENLKQWDKSEDYSSDNIYKKYFTFTFLKYLNNSFVKEHKDIIDKKFNSFVNFHFTTGFLTILFGLYYYDICEICGFGFSNTRYLKNTDPTFFYEKTEDKRHTGKINHDYNLEHSFYDKWQQYLPEQFYRIDDKYDK